MSLDHRTAAVGALVGGFILGFLDFVWIKFVPFPLAELGNSPAVWAVAAFTFGYRVPSGRVRAAVGATVLLVVAVPSYYLAASMIQNDDYAVIWASTSFVWMFFGVLAGTVFGVAGSWARSVGWQKTVGLALPGAVLFAEALLLLRRSEDPSYVISASDIILRTVLGVLVIVLFARTNRNRATALASALPLALVGYAGFAAGGFI